MTSERSRTECIPERPGSERFLEEGQAFAKLADLPSDFDGRSLRNGLGNDVLAKDPAIRAFEAAERRLFERYDVSYRSHFFDLPEPGVRTRVIEVGSGSPVLFVHGGGSIAAQWVPLVARLSGFRMLLVDRPGHGLSGGFDYRGVDLRRHAVAFLDGVIDALGLDAVPIVASSMGGAWTLRLAQERPERVTAMVQLGCPALLLETSAPLPMRLLGMRGLGKLMWSARKPSVKMMKDIHRMMGHEREALDRLPDELWEVFFRSAMLPPFERAWLSLLHCAIGPSGPRVGQSIGEDELRSVSQPTLFVWGDGDAFGEPEVGRRATSLMPNAQIEFVPGGHQPWFEAPERSAEAVAAFLANLG